MSLCLVVALGISSCEPAEDDIRPEPRALGGYAHLPNRTISPFDQNEDLSINLFTAEGVEVESVEILQDGEEVIGDATVSDETASFNASILGDFYEENDDGELEMVESFPIVIRTNYSNGNVSEDPFTVSLNPAISLGEITTETTLDSIASDTLRYDVSTLSATVDDVSLFFKKNEDGTYTDTGLDLSIDEDSVAIGETNFEELDLATNDTLFYKFRATSGSLTDEVESYIAILPKDFQSSYSVTLSEDSSINQLDLAAGEISADGEEDAEIRFLEPTGFEVTEGTDLKFVEVNDDFYENADVLSAREAYEDGIPITSATNLENGDVFVYKVIREVEIEDEDGNVVTETKTFYGVLRIGSFTVVDGDVVSYEIDYFEGR